MRPLALAALIALTLVGCATPTEPAASPSPTLEAAPSPQPVVTPVVTGPVTVSNSGLDSLQVEQKIAPVSLSIESVNLQMPIMPVGVDDDGQMEIPFSAADAGWYRFGASPASEFGNTVIAAHVDDARMGLGPFSRLRDMSEGDLVEVVMEDDTTMTYRVFEIEQTSKQEVDMDTVFANGDQQNLVLVTCGGRWDRDARHYEDNVVVWAEPLGSSP